MDDRPLPSRYLALPPPTSFIGDKIAQRDFCALDDHKIVCYPTPSEYPRKKFHKSTSLLVFKLSLAPREDNS